MTRRLPQSTAYTVVFKVFLASDHVTPATSKTVAITLSKAGAAFGNPAAGASSATEIANGWYKFALGTGDTDTLGDLVLVGTATACDSADIVMMVVSATNGGATNLDAAVSSRLAPTVAARTLDVSATGEAGLDWANIGSPLTAVGLFNTQIQTVTQVLTCNYTALVEEVNSLVPGAIDAAALGDDVYDKISDGVWDENMGGHLGTYTSGEMLNNTLKPTLPGNTLDVSDTGEAGIDWGNVGDKTATVHLANTSISDALYVQTVGMLDPAAIGAGVFSNAAKNEMADAILNRDMAAGPDSGADDLRTPRQALRFLRNKWTVVAGVLTVYDESDSGVSWTATLSSTPGADPITGSDPG